MSLLELHQVSKTYGAGPNEVHAIVDIDLVVDRGSLIAIMGPSGSGKSTLLTISGSLEEPTSGEVLIDGDSLQEMSRNGKARLRRRTIGYVFQEFNLLAGLTALENVSLPLELDGVSARKARLAGMAVLEDLGLANGEARDPDELSGGERQRVAIAVGRHRRTSSSAGGRTVWRARSGERGSRDADASCRLQERRRGGGRHPRRPTRLVGRPRRLLARRSCRRPDGTSAERRVPAADRAAIMTPAPDAAPDLRGGGPGSVSARRAVMRWAWRLFRREWRQQLLVLTLIVVVVGAIFVAAAVATNNPTPANLGFGTASDLATYQGAVPTPSAKVAALEHRFGRTQVIEDETLSIPGSVDTYQLRAESSHGPFSGPMLSLVAGKYPTGPGEVALTGGVASAFNVHIGQLWSEGATQRRVVGIVEDPLDTLDAFALVVPGQVRNPTEVDLLFDAPGVDPSTIGPNVAA